MFLESRDEMFDRRAAAVISLRPPGGPGNGIPPKTARRLHSPYCRKAAEKVRVATRIGEGGSRALHPRTNKFHLEGAKLSGVMEEQSSRAQCKGEVTSCSPRWPRGRLACGRRAGRVIAAIESRGQQLGARTAPRAQSRPPSIRVRVTPSTVCRRGFRSRRRPGSRHSRTPCRSPPQRCCRTCLAAVADPVAAHHSLANVRRRCAEIDRRSRSPVRWHTIQRRNSGLLLLRCSGGMCRSRRIQASTCLWSKYHRMSLLVRSGMRRMEALAHRSALMRLIMSCSAENE